MSKVAVVTAGAGGIGQAVAERFAQDGSRILLLDVNAQTGNQVAAALLERGAKTAFFPIDLTQESEVQALFEQIVAAHKRIDVLVNVAGGSLHRHPLANFPLPHWRAVIDANLTSTFPAAAQSLRRWLRKKVVLSSTSRLTSHSAATPVGRPTRPQKQVFSG
jgi:NAD(P)-dependent dehydrogenase (short-subunit alcohol dehydrogenase family)